MKLTIREKVMISVLVIVGVVVLSYIFLVKPQLEKIANLVLEREKYRVEVQKIKDEISLDNKLDEDYKDLKAKISEQTKGYFPVILEDKMIVMLDDLLKNSEVNSGSVSFIYTAAQPLEAVNTTSLDVVSPLKELVNQYKAANGEAVIGSQITQDKTISPAKENDNLLDNMSATIQFSSSFEQLMQFIKALEGMEKKIVIKNLDIAGTPDNQLSGNINLILYSLPKIEEQDKEYFDWPLNNQYGKSNPFSTTSLNTFLLVNFV